MTDHSCIYRKEYHNNFFSSFVQSMAGIYKNVKLHLRLISFTALTLCIAGIDLHAQLEKSNRILFLGNSVFYHNGGVYQSFEGFCRETGLDYQAVSQLKAPANTHGIEFLEYGRVPLNLVELAEKEEIHELIKNGNYAFVILEARRPGYLLPEWVEFPADRDYGYSIPYEKNINALGRIHQTIVESGAQTVLYMHPGYRDLPEIRLPLTQLYQRFQNDLKSMKVNGKQSDVILVPASLLWKDAIDRFGIDNWYSDHVHGKPLARYASGCMLYTFITGKDPSVNPFNELPKSWSDLSEKPTIRADETDVNWIKKQVWLYYTTRP
jgi:hypothetical protein